MDNRVYINQPLRPVQKNKSISRKSVKKDKDFSKILAGKLREKSGVKFSKHAQKRLISRNINLHDSELEQLRKGVNKAEDKGCCDSLIMVNNIAYIVSVENRTVVTAVDDSSVKENVFTNIDSAVFM